MGKKAKEIITFDVEELILLLNKALADEWFAYYQYWISARIVTGPMRQAAVLELTEHAEDELKHADMLSERIIQLGGVPVTNPSDWGKLANCSYIDPTDPYIESILQQGIDGERCAIDVYNDLLRKVKDKDIITYDMILSILKDEIEHEEDFEALLGDLNLDDRL